jgi:hypothetical protein
MIKTFRGLIADGAQDTIVLHTNTGAVGYQIVKFNIMPETPMDGNEQQAVVKIYKIKQTAITDDVDFSDNTLIGVALMRQTADIVYDQTIMFDKEIFNQDIFVTFEDQGSSGKGINYYLELEQIKLDLNENTVATLKNIRNTTEV